MTEDKIWELISRYITHEATDEEIKLVLEWGNKSFENRNILDHALLIMTKQAPPQFDSIKAFEKLDKKISKLS